MHAFVAFGGLCVFAGFSLAIIAWFKQHSWPLTIILAASGLVIGVIIWGVAAIAYRQCEETATAIDLEFEHSLLTGCWVEVDDNFVNINWLRIVP